LKLDRRKHIGFEFVLPRIVWRTEIAALDGGAALIEGVPCAVLTLVNALAMEIELPAAVCADNSVFKEIDQRSADFFRALHLLNPCPCSSVPYLTNLLEVLTGDNRLVSIGKNNPFLAVNMLIPDALVDGVQRPSENGISDVMGIIQN